MKFADQLRSVGLVLVLGLFSIQASARTGGSNGGGGYSVRCTDGKFYAMDFLATQTTPSRLDPQIEMAKTAGEIYDRILGRLQEVLPELAVSYKDFIAFNDRESNTSTTRLWIKGNHPLEKLTDQQRIRDLRACIGLNNEADIRQAVIRQQYPNGITYQRDEEQMSNLNQAGPLQLSFTGNHEWLRDFTDDAAIIMQVNYFLHSRDFFELSVEEIKRVLQRHGLDNLPGIDRVANLPMPPLSIIKATWNGTMAFPAGLTSLQLSYHLCQAKKEAHDLRLGEDLYPINMEGCQLVQPPAKIQFHDNRSWYQRILFPSPITDPVHVVISGAMVNEYIRQTGLSAKTCYLVARIELLFGERLVYGVDSVPLSEVVAAETPVQREIERSDIRGHGLTTTDATMMDLTVNYQTVSLLKP